MWTDFDYYTGKLTIVEEIPYSDGERAKVRCYGANDVREGVAIMHHECRYIHNRKLYKPNKIQLSK